MEVQKRQRGRPKKIDKKLSFVLSFRVNETTKDFVNSLDNKTRFINELIFESKEYKNYLSYKKINDNSPSLFDFPAN